MSDIFGFAGWLLGMVAMFRINDLVKRLDKLEEKNPK